MKDKNNCPDFLWKIFYFVQKWFPKKLPTKKYLLTEASLDVFFRVNNQWSGKNSLLVDPFRYQKKQ